MKKQFLALLMIACCQAAFTQKITIKGKTAFDEPAEKIFLVFSKGDERILDSSKITGGTFKFIQKVSEPALATLYVRFAPKETGKMTRLDRIQFFIEPGTIKVAAGDTLANAVITGSRSNKVFDKLKTAKKPYEEKLAALSRQYGEYYKVKDQEGMNKIDAAYDEVNEKMKEEVYSKFIAENTQSPVSLYALDQVAGYDIDPAVAEPLFNKLSTELQHTYAGKEFSNKIEKAKKTAVGAMAPEFTQADTLGNPVALSSFRGKYVLLDFWASWCGPCRAENPNVVKAFNEYKDRNFTVLGISLDQPGKKEAWMKAIYDDKLAWTQLSDLKGWNNEVSKQYGIQAIPQNFLIDPSGKIVAKNIRGEKLQKKLEELIK